jgi:predicted nucleic acid-binding protein
VGRLILPDTSAWIELRRATEGPLDVTLTWLLDDGADIAVTEPVVMELLSGARSRRDLVETRELLLNLPMLRVGGLDTYERAADIARICRLHGETIRRGLDCLVAAVAIREDVSVLHADRDFDAIARHTELRVEPVRRPGRGRRSM